MLNKSNYLLETLIWMKTKDATRRYPENRPKPFVPEFLKTPYELSAINGEPEIHTTEDIKNILSKPRV